MGCGSSLNQVSDSHHRMSSSHPLRIQQMMQSSDEKNYQIQDLYLFGQTHTKRKILNLSIRNIQKQNLQTDVKISLIPVLTRHHIPRPKIKRDTLEMLYEEAQQVFPSNLCNTTTLPPFNLMLIVSLSKQLMFLCGGVDFQFWNVNSQAFLYKINNSDKNSVSNIDIDKKSRLQRPQSTMSANKSTEKTDRTSKKNFNQFQRLSFMNQPRYSHSGLSTKVNNKKYIYVFGGYGSTRQALKTAQRYSFERNLWQKIPDMGVLRATGFCFQFLAKIYVFGGFTHERKRSKKIQVWDLNQQHWKILNVKLHQGIQQGYLSSFNPNQIIVVGGNVEGGPINSVIRVNIIQETYQWDSNLVFSDSLQKGTIFSRKLYLFGGQKPQFCQIYDEKNRLWSSLKVGSQQVEQSKIGQLTLFSSITKSVNIEFVMSSNNYKTNKKLKTFQICDLLIFGIDSLPIIFEVTKKSKQGIRDEKLISHYEKQIIRDEKQILKQDKISLSMKSITVPMRLRLRKSMGILRLSANQYFICGGIDSFEINPTKATFKYFSSQKKAIQLQKMPIKKYNFTLCKKYNFIYCIGGCIQTQKGDQAQTIDCSRYDLINQKWQLMSHLNYPRSQCQVIPFQNGIIVFGGFFDGQWVQKIQIFHTQSLLNKFKVLQEKLPLLFPLFSQICISETASKLFIVNRNIHMNTIQQLYFNLTLSKSLPSDKIINRQLDTLQQFDSIDVIINQKIQIQQQQNKSATNKHYPFSQENKHQMIEEQNSIDQNGNTSVNRLVKIAPIKQYQSSQIIQMPTVNVIEMQNIDNQIKNQNYQIKNQNYEMKTKNNQVKNKDHQNDLSYFQEQNVQKQIQIIQLHQNNQNIIKRISQHNIITSQTKYVKKLSLKVQQFNSELQEIDLDDHTKTKEQSKNQNQIKLQDQSKQQSKSQPQIKSKKERNQNKFLQNAYKKNKNQTSLDFNNDQSMIKGLKTQIYEQFYEHDQIKKNKVTISKQNTINRHSILHSSHTLTKYQSYYAQKDKIKESQKQIIPGLDQIKHFNQWIRIRQSFEEQNKSLYFINNFQIIKCSFKKSINNINIQIDVTYHKIDHEDNKIFSSTNQKGIKIQSFKQNYF